MDWSLLQTLVLVAEHGSLSAAAKASHRSQPTLSRHIAQLEDALGGRVFLRHSTGLELTALGEKVLKQAGAMADAAGGLATLSVAPASAMSGTVRITASEMVSTFLLPDLLTAFHGQEPGIELEVVASDETDNLLRREADIALRMYRPQHLDLIAQKIGDFSLGAYASTDYIQRRGKPDSTAALLTHDVIGYDRSPLILQGLKQAGLSVEPSFFKFRSDNQVACWMMVLAGFGIGFNQCAIGDPDPRVERIETEKPIGSLPLWLTAHPDVKRSARVRRVYDFLADALRERAR
ncbi:MAG: LysR family transcriptional regulator [Pseudomonadota bacterium]